MFGFGSPIQSRLGPLAARFSQQQPAPQPPGPMDFSKFGTAPSPGDLRTGLQKLGIGQPQGAPAGGAPMGGAPSPMTPPGPQGYTPPFDPSQMNWGSVMGPAMGGSSAAAPQAAGAATGDAAAASGMDIGSLLSTVLPFLGL